MTKLTGTSSETDFRQLPVAQMGAIVSRFEERVDEAQRAHPPNKDEVKKAIHRKGASRSPVRLKRLSCDVIIRYGDAFADLFCEFPDDLIFIAPYDIFIGYQGPDRKGRTNPVEVMMKAAEWTDEWGTRWAHAFGGVGACPIAYPIKDWSQLDGYLATRMPDAREPGRLDAAKPILEMHSQTKYSVAMIHISLFERLQGLRGMENLFVDFYTNEREVRRLADAITNYLLELIRSWAEIGPDAILLTDDWGTQASLMVSLDMWRKFFERFYRTVFDEAHRLGMDVFFHSCGNIMQIIPKLIDIGVDVIDPVQPGAIDLSEVARNFGGKVAFSGGIDVQRLASYSPRQVKDEVRSTISTLGKPFGNAYVVSPANALTPEIPLENLQALFEACHDQ